MFGLRETGWEGVEWIDLAQYRDEWCSVVNAVMKESDIRNARKSTDEMNYYIPNFYQPKHKHIYIYIYIYTYI